MGSYWRLFGGASCCSPHVAARARFRESGLVLPGVVLANSPLRMEKRQSNSKRSLPTPYCGNNSGKGKLVSLN